MQGYELLVCVGLALEERVLINTHYSLLQITESFKNIPLGGTLFGGLDFGVVYGVTGVCGVCDVDVDVDVGVGVGV